MDLASSADAATLEVARFFAGHEAGAVVTEREGMLLIASAVPTTSLFHSAARRVAPDLVPGDAIAAIRDFAGEHAREMVLWASSHADADLIAAAEARGFSAGSDLAGMVIDAAPALPVVPAAVELVQVTTAESASAFADIHRSLYADAGRPPEAVLHFASADVLLAPQVSAFVAYLDGHPASCAMAITTDRIAGLYWVATAHSARNRGLGTLTSLAATRAAFAAGAEHVVLQATKLGFPVYLKIGYAQFTTYMRCLIQP